MSEFKFTEESFEKFKSLYNESVENKSESFEFEGHEVLTTFAKYVIEYIEHDTRKS
jgi:hypothetical protein